MMLPEYNREEALEVFLKYPDARLYHVARDFEFYYSDKRLLLYSDGCATMNVYELHQIWRFLSKLPDRPSCVNPKIVSIWKFNENMRGIAQMKLDAWDNATDVP